MGLSVATSLVLVPIPGPGPGPSPGLASLSCIAELGITPGLLLLLSGCFGTCFGTAGSRLAGTEHGPVGGHPGDPGQRSDVSNHILCTAVLLAFLPFPGPPRFEEALPGSHRCLLFLDPK